jgi:hypothetical protein
VIAAAYQFFLAGRMIWTKFRRVQSYRTRMREGFGRLYSMPTEPVHVDLSNDYTPTLLKCTAELEALGARHVCDVSIRSGASTPMEGNRYFVLGDASIALGLLRRWENLLFFPAKPILLATTRFGDGRKHITLNQPIFRKKVRAENTVRCLLTDDGMGELLALHRQRVDRLIAGGAIAVPPPLNAEEVFAQMRQVHEEKREIWARSPYSWGDALHGAFKVCRREYLAD